MRGPRDDFFCLKYQVWYPVEDCVYRGVHKTFPGCVNCFQGSLNIRNRGAGAAPPSEEPPGPRDAPGLLIPLKRT